MTQIVLILKINPDIFLLIEYQYINIHIYIFKRL